MDDESNYKNVCFGDREDDIHLKTAHQITM